jgi:hypothetical protein
MPDADGAETTFRFTSLFHLRTRVFLGPAEPVDAPRALGWDLVGLQHFSSHVETRPELDGWMRHLDDPGVANSKVLREAQGLVVQFRDSDPIPLEVCRADMASCEEMSTTLARSRAAAAKQRRREQQP